MMLNIDALTNERDRNRVTDAIDFPPTWQASLAKSNLNMRHATVDDRMSGMTD